MTPHKNIDDDMVVELGPSAVNSEAKPVEEKETVEAEKDDEVAKEDEADVVVDDYEEQEDNGERFLDDHLTKLRNSKTVSYTP